MKREIVGKAENVIKARRLSAEKEFEAQKQKLYADKNFANIEKEYKKIIIENAKNAIYNEKIDEKTQKNLEKTLNSYYEENNIPKKPKFSCPLCQDLGYKNGQMCKCLKKEISHILFKESNFGSLVTFKEAKKNVSGTMKVLYDKMEQWCNGDFKKNLLFISGNVGVGKSYLTKAIANDLIEKGKIVKLVTAFQMSKDFKEYRSTYNESIFDKYLDCEFLFIDDLGTETIYKNSTVELLFHVINERKIRKACTIITSNLYPNEIRDIYDERIYSRIADQQTSICLRIESEDMRLKSKK